MFNASDLQIVKTVIAFDGATGEEVEIAIVTDGNDQSGIPVSLIDFNK